MSAQDKHSSAEHRCAFCGGPLPCLTHNVHALAQSSQVPEGWKLVPLIPTPEMIEVGRDNNSTQWNEGTDRSFPADVANDVYVSMVRAAQPPAAPVETFDVLQTIDPDYADSFERQTCKLCNCSNGHSISCPTISRDYIEAAPHPRSSADTGGQEG